MVRRQTQMAGQEKKGKTKGITVSDRRNITLTHHCVFKRSISTYRQCFLLSVFFFFYLFVRLIFCVFYFSFFLTLVVSFFIFRVQFPGLCYDHNETQELYGNQHRTAFWLKTLYNLKTSFVFHSDNRLHLCFCIIWIPSCEA